jgi:TldD protein
MGSKITRRSFLGRGAMGLAAAAFVPAIFKGNPSVAFATPKGDDMKLADLYRRFTVDEEIIKKVIAEALSKGADYCDLYFEHTISNFVGMEDHTVNRAYSRVGYGVGIRALKGDRTGYSYTEELTLESMRQAARTAANIADASPKSPPVETRLYKTPQYYPIDAPWTEVSVDRKIPILERVDAKMFELDSRVAKASVSLADTTKVALIATSEGRIAYDFRPMSTIAAGCTAIEGDRKESNHHSRSGRVGFETFTDAAVDKLATEAVERTVRLFQARQPKAGETPVVLAAGGSGILLHEAIGHGMEADFNRKGVSIFSDKMDKKISNEHVTIVDDGTNPNVRGSINVDDEANPTERTVLVENGVLRSYLHDRLSAAHYGVEPTGNGRRESFRHPVLPRMRNTYMEAGPHDEKEIIKSVKRGLYAESFTNGQVFIGAGDFTFYVKSGYAIEDGELAYPVKDVNIIGNGPEALADVQMVGNNFAMDEGGWNCGKDGQSVPVSLGLPSVKVGSITVGGV